MAPAAVITADIVNSLLLRSAQRHQLMTRIARLARPHTLDFYRGDSFQVYLRQPSDALRLVLLLRTAAKSIEEKNAIVPVYDIRAAIGIGQVHTPVKNLRTATGEAFVLSGQNLEQMQKQRQRIIMASGKREMNSALAIMAYFIDYLMSRMTSKQAIVVCEMLQGQTQTRIAKKLKKSQATISQHLHAAGWQEIEQLLKEFGNLMAQWQ